MIKNHSENRKLKRLIIILGPGRSGTSLLTQLLESMGMKISENLSQPNLSNIEGFWEDADIVNLHKKLLIDINANPYLPLPDNWMNTNATEEAKNQIKQILNRESNLNSTIWGFKDPRINAFLPLWFQVLNSLRYTPIFVLSVRHISAVAISCFKQYGTSQYIAELLWLNRIIDALHYTSADCFIVHYEDWFAQPSKLAQELLIYTGLDQHFTGNVNEAFKDIIKPNLNRSVHEEYQVKNEYVLKLYDVLKDCRGADFDRTRLMAVVKECRQAMDGFKGWYLIAQENIARVSNLQEQLQIAKEKQAEIPELRKRIQQLERENRRLSQIETEILRAEQALNHLTKLYPSDISNQNL
ncbi:sulfotransferase family protein [Limnospira platensis]|uniref:sulfotransferase family protein n=1 Tax=Limnospira platensis TaxID=118562 RepID=UPI003D6FA854